MTRELGIDLGPDDRAYLPDYLRLTMEDTGLWVRWCVEIACLASEETRFIAARHVAVTWAINGLRAARILGLYFDDETEP